MPIFLLALYAKNEKADLSSSDRREFATLTSELAKQWKRK